MSPVSDGSAPLPSLPQYYEGSNTAEGLRSKAEVLRTLGFCSVGLITSFLIWGILQERMLTMPYRYALCTTYHSKSAS